MLTVSAIKSSIKRIVAVLVQKLESVLKNVPALMLVGQNNWIRDEPMYQFYAATANHVRN